MPATNTSPSRRLTCPLPQNSQASSDTPIRMGTSKRTSWRCTTSGTITADKPRMNNTLRMLLPTTLPTAMSDWPLRLAPIDTASSGELVPTATTVSPTINGGMPRAAAMREAPRTRASAPTMRRANPAINWKTINALIYHPSTADYYGCKVHEGPRSLATG